VEQGLNHGRFGCFGPQVGGMELHGLVAAGFEAWFVSEGFRGEDEGEDGDEELLVCVGGRRGVCGECV
jgi:hypothetical protein